ncbi:MAG: SecD/SecF family protein translocase subunit, partial [Patescibacteria group bacterium]
SGGFSLTDAKLLAQRLNAGALPVPVDLVAQQTVGATLGADSLAKSLKAGIAALALVMIFMLVYYRMPGVLAIIGLLMYSALSLAIFKAMGVTLTLAGIAGFILSIGMAVDANILVFERMKEELRAGRSLRGAVEEGFVRAWSSIRDGNSSVFITCAILIWFGSSFVKGFAITLAIGTLVSVFTAITVTRTLLRFIVPWFPEHANWMFLGARKKDL